MKTRFLKRNPATAIQKAQYVRAKKREPRRGSAKWSKTVR